MTPLLLALGLGPALADEAPPQAVPIIDEPASYALVVGSHRPGPGQETLRYAGQDASRMAEVLSHVGGFEEGRVMRLEDPSLGELRGAIEGFGEVLAAHERENQPTSFLFYYSGHARAQGLDLGGENLELSQLRTDLEDLEARLTMVVLDACQSGAVSDIKGVEPAAHFSSASVAGLQSEGFVVIASSTGSELSQESQELGGSFFTHHLTAGLMGAADDDHDGLVTLSEAYEYTYAHTPESTAATAVGAQHATLETDLKGQGELVLTRPSEASARLVLPAELAGDLLITRRSSHSVVAEVHKAAGPTQELALVPGAYQIILREPDMRWRCAAVLAEGDALPLDRNECEVIDDSAVAAKGSALKSGEDEVAQELARLPEPRRRKAPEETLFIELSIGVLSPQHDGYITTLGRFGFDEGLVIFPGDLAGTLGASWSVHRNLAVIGTVGKLDDERRSRPVTSTTDSPQLDHSFNWIASRAGGGVRGQLPLLNGLLVPYAQTSGGLGWSRTFYQDSEGEEVQAFFGPWLGVGGGLQIVPRFGDWRHVGIYLLEEWITAPIIDNLLGQRHDSGGPMFSVGLRVGG